MLTPKKIRFCQEYVIDLNGTQAATRAGYSEKTANEQASRLLANVNVQDYIRELQKKISERTEITADRVLQEYARIAFIDPRRLFDENGKIIPIHQLDEDSARAIAGLDHSTVTSKNGDIETDELIRKIKLVDKKGALDSVARHLGMFNDRMQVEVKTDKKIKLPDGTEIDI